MWLIGAAETDITPSPGSQSPGGFAKRMLDQVIEPLKAVALVIQSGDQIVALAGVDCLFVTDSLVARARAAVERETQIPPHAILIAASHTHSGGPVADCFGSEADPEYVHLVADRAADAIIQADRSLHACDFGHGMGNEPAIAFNRRFLMRDGTEVTHPGKKHPEIIAPAGPADPDVGVLAARAPDGRIIAVFVNFACHATVSLGNGFSPDYIAPLRTAVRRHIGNPRLPVGFLPGACGDVTQVDNTRPGSEFGPAWAVMMGEALAAEVIHTLGRIAFTPDGPLKAVRASVPIPLRSDEECARPGPRLGLGSGPDADAVFAREREILKIERARNPLVQAEVQALRIGDLALVANGAELFCQVGLNIKKASPFSQTWISTMTNQWIGYVPTASAYHAGGYEPRAARSSKLVAAAAQSLQESSLNALRMLSAP
jgi:hypothetical protein